MAESKARSPSCLLLDKLPAELRNEIYELVYPTKPDANTAVQLLEARPPNDKSLLLTCRQIRSEASSYYKESYRNYWQGSPFTIDLQHEDRASTKEFGTSGSGLALASMKASDLDQITDLAITRYGVDIRFKYSLVHSMGLWFHEAFDRSAPESGSLSRGYVVGVESLTDVTLTWSMTHWKDEEVAKKMVKESFGPAVQHLQIVGMLCSLMDDLPGYESSAIPIQELPKVLGSVY